MLHLLPLFMLIPFGVLLLSLFIPGVKEQTISGITLLALGTHLAGAVLFFVWWIAAGSPQIDIRHFTVYSNPEFEFFISYYFDKISAVFLVTGSLLTFLVGWFSKFYMHREAGFKRFFNTLLIFFAGYNLIVISGNFETLFVGWELLGISSFLLIAFYRDRYLPVKNAMKVISIYRVGDICLMLAMWMSHHIWHKNITFAAWNAPGAVQELIHTHYLSVLFIALMIVIAATIKSAQLPFSAWLPRAMEGPTTSSAIFYGSLSVHIGAFLLLRTYPFWEAIVGVKILVIAIGLITTVLSTWMAGVQSTVKTQIAYGAITQIGLIFIEIALGFHVLALVHFTGNALLRTYQLLVSPSVLSYLTHDMFFYFKPKKHNQSASLLNRVRNTIYLLSVKEWNLDGMLYRTMWRPFKWIGNRLGFLDKWPVLAVILIAPAAVMLAGQLSGNDWLQQVGFLPAMFSIIALVLVIRAFTSRGDARNAFVVVVVSQLFMVLSVVTNAPVETAQVVIYLSGTIIAAVTGFSMLRQTYRIDRDISLHQYHGYSYETPQAASFFLLSCLGLAGFPVTPTFIGVDLFFTKIHEGQPALILITALNFLLLELTLLRIYARIYLGQHKKLDHPVAFRSS